MKETMKVCIAWIDFPEDAIFVILEVSLEEYRLLETFNGHYINPAPEEVNEQMTNFFYENGRFKYEDKKQSDIVKVGDQGIERIMIYGFIL